MTVFMEYSVCVGVLSTESYAGTSEHVTLPLGYVLSALLQYINLDGSLGVHGSLSLYCYSCVLCSVLY